MRFLTIGSAVIMACLIASAPASAKDPEPDLSGVSLPCQQAYRAMKACLAKALDAGAPEAVRAPWEKQIADSVQMWRTLRGRPEVEKSCKEIAAKRDCD